MVAAVNVVTGKGRCEIVVLLWGIKLIKPLLTVISKVIVTGVFFCGGDHIKKCMD